MKNRFLEKIQQTALGARLLSDPRFRTILAAALTMGWNLAYGLFNGLLGAFYRSAWFYAMGAYHLALGLMRLIAVSSARGGPEHRPSRRTGAALGAGMAALAVILSVIVELTIADSVGTSYPMAIMIAIAAFTFFTVIRSIVLMIRAHRNREGLTILLRNISCASAVGSVLSLERSMLGTFGSSTDRFTYVTEGVSGLVGFLIVLALGVSMLLGSSRRRERQEYK